MYGCCASGATLPVVTLVLGGDGLKTIDRVKAAVESRRPVVIVKGSSRVPTLLAELFYVLEDKVPRYDTIRYDTRYYHAALIISEWSHSHVTDVSM